MARTHANTPATLPKTISVFLVALLALAAGLTGCGKNQKTVEEGGQVALTPNGQPTQACAIGATQNFPHAYQTIGLQPYSTPQPGVPWGLQHHLQTGFCGCPAGTIALCDAQYGLTCAPSGLMSGFEVQVWRLAPQGAFVPGGFSNSVYEGYGNVFLDRPVVIRRDFGAPSYGPRPGYTRPLPRPAGTCGTNIGRTCAVGTNQCALDGQFSRCAPLAPGSSVGVCVR